LDTSEAERTNYINKAIALWAQALTLFHHFLLSMQVLSPQT
jgi:hypothetical protein